MNSSASTLPAAVASEDELEELLARPSPADVAFARTLLVRMVLARAGLVGADLVTRPREVFDLRGALARFVIAVPCPEPSCPEGSAL